MKLLLVTFVLFSISVFSQNKRYYDYLDRTEAEKIHPRPASNSELAVIDFDQHDYTGLIIHQLNAARLEKNRTAFEIDSAFQQVCNTGVKHFSSTYFKSNKNRERVVKHTEFGIRHLEGKNRLFKVFTLYVNLTKLTIFKPFFYHSKDQNTSLKLYKGKRPKTLNPDHPDYVEPEPVKPITELEFVNNIEIELKKRMGLSEFFSKTNTHFGVAARVDEFSVNRKKIPHAFVMIIIGGKQTQKVKLLPTPPALDDPNDPLLILK